MKIGVSLRSAYAPMDARTGARWHDRAGPAPQRGRASTACSSAITTTCRCPYYQNVPMLGRLLAEWDDRPAGALFLLAALASGAARRADRHARVDRAGPFVMQCALGGGDEQFDALDVPIAPATVAVRSDARHRPPPVRGRGGDDRRAVPHRAGAHRADPARAARGVDRRCGAARDRPRRAARRRVPDRSGGNPRTR